MRAKKKGKLLAARAEQALVEQLPVDQKTLRRVSWLMDPKHLKLVGIGAIGCTAAVSLFKNAGQMRLYRAAMGRELKKQLEPVNRKLSELEKQNEELKQQNLKLQQQMENMQK